MKKFLQIPLLLVALFLTSIPISAYDFEVDGIYYNYLSKTAKTVEVTYKGPFLNLNPYDNNVYNSITILSQVTYKGETYSVTSIGSNAFYGCSSLKVISIPKSVTSIDASAFSGCSGLLSFSIPNSVTRIGASAFKGCSGLMSITIPNSVTSIGDDAFAGTGWYKNQDNGILYLNNCCLGYKGNAPTGKQSIKEGTRLISGAAFQDCTNLTSVSIPNSVTSIGASTFQGCTGLTSISIPNSVTSIGASTFQGCTGLTSISIPNSVTSIGASTFQGCTGLTSISIPDSIAYIGQHVFQGCTNLTDITIANSVTKIGYRAFSDCVSLTSITIPDSVAEISSEAFKGCTGLTTINFNAQNCTSMGGDSDPVFYGCDALNTINIGNNVETIPSYAFQGCTGLTSITIPNSVTLIGSEAFSGCTGLTTVNLNAENCSSMGTYYSSVFNGCKALNTINIGNNVKRIPNYAFCGCTSLTLITIPNSVTVIGSSAFSSCTGLTTITIPNSVTSIGTGAFSSCSGLTEITIPNSVTTIGYDAFRDCTGLKSITIPDSVTEVGQGAFYNCTSLTIVNFNAENCTTTWNGAAFYGCETLKTINIGNNVKRIPGHIFGGCTGLISITIPNSVTEIDYAAFGDCTGLTTISIPNSVTTIDEYAFYGCTKLVSEPTLSNITETTATISSLSTPTNYPPYLFCNNKYYKNGDKITGLTPNLSYSCYYGLEINGNYCQINTNSLTFKTSPIYMYLNGTANATSIIANGTHSIGDATFVSEGLDLNASGSFDNRNEKIFYNLDPNTSYNVYYGLKVKENTSPYSVSKSFKTGDLDLTTQEARPTSTTSVRLLAATNCDATEGTGFEWRRYDAPDELPSSKVSCPVVDGVLVGSLRGVKDDVYYKYRPFYTSSSGKTYYGDWIAFFTGDANVYFEPEVRTYEDIQVINNSATVKGYALEGTDVITSQGFEYWKTGSTIKPASTDDRMTVSASGISMSATLANLEYNSTYKYRAYVTTAKGTVYGDEMEFSTGEDPSGIGYIEIDSDEFVVTLRENPATGTAWVKIAGAAGEEVQYTLTSMSGAMVANGTVLLDGEWNAIDLNCSAGMYLLTINDGTQVKTLRLIVK
ncbi:MAG: leucine-rich repeat domain-containing protein [Muribaculaceae bacterium]|nr:leucine-rich repeat domain-containing protein [Muribaculaceae bacterium]